MELITKESLQSKIFTIRGVQVMIDRDLADLYKVEVKRLNEQVYNKYNLLRKSIKVYHQFFTDNILSISIEKIRLSISFFFE